MKLIYNNDSGYELVVLKFNRKETTLLSYKRIIFQFLWFADDNSKDIKLMNYEIYIEIILYGLFK